MKSPAQLAALLARQWLRPGWREQQLLGGSAAWPLRLSIGLPDTAVFREGGAELRAHLQRWQQVRDQGLGQVQWLDRQYRDGATPVALPCHWLLQRPSDYLAAMTGLRVPQHVQIAADYRALTQVLGAVDAPWHSLLVRRLALWRHLQPAQVIQAVRMAAELSPGCAQGRPLRALAMAGADSKFFERHEGLLKALLDLRFEGQASRLGLADFLGASSEGEHWLLVAPLAPGLLPFERLRVTAAELARTALPARRILVIENERCLHLLPQPLADTVAILGAGLNLGWLAAPWLRECSVAYWGDMDSWGLAMLAQARSHVPHLQALLMERDCFAAHRHLAVAEPQRAEPLADAALAPEQAALDQLLRSLEKGRLEQEFLSPGLVAQAIRAWAQACPPASCH
ncbi:Wadjet anti-phage system protein JetD domain-containing protein [Comamonas composti]|uniref:Wadjet anti-phage system protein JetD domain-containing protein n=1 Tax=Comamonas composti TaxID=408558 RepID=UPI00040851BD|nr:Wadjet anti-phage system protein JetD domain-containing protein [Comamonas composti]